jgi:hypothetical protein
MELDAENLGRHLPYYLTAQDQQELVKELRAIASGGTANYFLSAHNDTFREEMLQGDGWRGFQLFLFDSGERRSIKGLVLSNSCDISPENSRDLPARVIFAPLVRLSSYRALLENSRISKEQVEAKITSIRQQKPYNIFFLPAGGPLEEDHIVRFDEAQSMPVSAHTKSAAREKLFTLSNTGFYMLTFKLSIHFCRLQEKIRRNALPQ